MLSNYFNTFRNETNQIAKQAAKIYNQWNETKLSMRCQ